MTDQEREILLNDMHAEWNTYNLLFWTGSPETQPWHNVIARNRQFEVYARARDLLLKDQPKYGGYRPWYLFVQPKSTKSSVSS